MHRVTHENNVSPRLPAQPYQIPLSSSDYCGRTLTQVIGNPGSSSFTQDASRVDVTLDILKKYLYMSRYKNENLHTVHANFMKSENLDPEAGIYFSLYGLTREGKLLFKWLDIAKDAHNLPLQESELFFKSKAEYLVHNQRNGRDLISEYNMECALAWHCWQNTTGQKISTRNFCEKNDLNFASMGAYLGTKGDLRERGLMQIKNRYGNTLDSIIESAKQALLNDSDNKYITETGKVTAEWKAFLLGCQLDIVLRQTAVPPTSDAHAASSSTQ